VAVNEVRVLVDGTATAEVLRLDEPLSFWGGVDPHTGDIIEKRHPQFGGSVAGKLVSMPAGRGSSSASSILAETLRLGVGPVGIVLEASDGILVAGALAARELYDAQCPVVVADVPMRTGETWSLMGARLVKV
jgi:predicted aconitase with swiveling domain